MLHDAHALDEARVLVIYIGGTIGMVHDAVLGYTPQAGFLTSNLRAQTRFHTDTGAGDSHIRVSSTEGPKELVSLVTPAQGQHGKRIRYCILEYERLIDSSEIEARDWITIATDIELNYTAFDSFIVLHGTDTMAYTASALSFLLEDLGKTVILTGAQISLAELFNDSIDNLLGALVIAASYTIPEVCLFFNHKLLRGNRSIKASSDDFEAFLSPNLPPLAVIGIAIELDWNRILRPGLRAFKAHKAFSSQVATLRIFPGITGASVRAFLHPGIRGLVLATFGAGNGPKKEELLSVLREAALERQVIIVNVTQCSQGAVSPDTYETGRVLSATGITSGADLTVESALAKLSYLLSKPELSPAMIRHLMTVPLRGELTPPISPTFSTPEPVDAGERLHALFSHVVGGARAKVINAGSVSLPGQEIPGELNPPWPATASDIASAEDALLPFLLSRAASRPGASLAALVATTPAPKILASLNDSSTFLLPPLVLAILSLSLPSVVLLLEQGASVHAHSHAIMVPHCNSPLFYAARLGSPAEEIVDALMAAGAFLSEGEIARGDVGVEIMRCRQAAAWACEEGSVPSKEIKPRLSPLDMWRRACSTESGLQRAVESAQALLSA